MINLLKETLRRVLPKNDQISIKINRNHPIITILGALNWTLLIDIVKQARKENGKQNRGPDPNYRVLVGALVVRSLKSSTLRETMELIQYHALMRLLCNLENSDWTPNYRTIHDFELALGEEGLKRVNEYILHIAYEQGFLQAGTLCADTTAQEASIPYPTEVGLAHQFVKSVTTSICNIGGKFRHLEDYAKKKLEDSVKMLKQHRFFSSSSEEKKEILASMIKNAKNLQKKTISFVEGVTDRTVEKISGHKKRSYNQLLDLLKVFGDLAPQMDYFLETGNVAKDKIVSLFQELVRSIPRGKDGKKTEFGIQWCIGQICGGYIFAFTNGRMYEGDYAVAAIEEQIRILGEVPKMFGYDRGAWSERHLKKMAKIGVEDIGVAPKGQSKWLVGKEKQKQIFSERAQVEGKIGTLKHYGLNKPFSKTSEGMLRTAQRAVVRFNLLKLAKDVGNLINSSKK